MFSLFQYCRYPLSASIHNIKDFEGFHQQFAERAEMMGNFKFSLVLPGFAGRCLQLAIFCVYFLLFMSSVVFWIGIHCANKMLS